MRVARRWERVFCSPLTASAHPRRFAVGIILHVSDWYQTVSDVQVRRPKRRYATAGCIRVGKRPHRHPKMASQRAVGVVIGLQTTFCSGCWAFHNVSWHVGADGEKSKISVFVHLGDLPDSRIWL